MRLLLILSAVLVAFPWHGAQARGKRLEVVTLSPEPAPADETLLLYWVSGRALLPQLCRIGGEFVPSYKRQCVRGLPPRGVVHVLGTGDRKAYWHALPRESYEDERSVRAVRRVKHRVNPDWESNIRHGVQSLDSLAIYPASARASVARAAGSERAEFAPAELKAFLEAVRPRYRRIRPRHIYSVEIDGTAPRETLVVASAVARGRAPDCESGCLWMLRDGKYRLVRRQESVDEIYGATDLDGDGAAEILVVSTVYESSTYDWLRWAGDRWQELASTESGT